MDPGQGSRARQIEGREGEKRRKIATREELREGEVNYGMGVRS